MEKTGCVCQPSKGRYPGAANHGTAGLVCVPHDWQGTFVDRPAVFINILGHRWHLALQDRRTNRVGRGSLVCYGLLSTRPIGRCCQRKLSTGSINDYAVSLQPLYYSMVL